MTITVDTGNITIATPQVNAGSPQSFDHTCGANVDGLVVVVTIYDTSGTDGVVSGVKYNGISFDSPAATLYYDALCDGHVSVWLLPSPITGDSYPVEVSFGGVVTDFEAAAIGIESTIGTFAKDSNGTPATGTSGDLTITWSTVATDTICFAAALDDQTDDAKVHPQETEIYTVDVGDVVSAEYAIRSSSGSQTMTIVDDDGDEDWVIVGAAFKEIVGATEYQQSADGVLTPAGDIVKSSGKIIAGITTLTGSISKATSKTFTGSSTLAGVLIKQTQKIFTGVSTFAGSLTASYQKLISLTGSLTPSGTIVKQAGKAFTGSITATGLLIRSTIKAITGSLTLSGILTTTKVTLLSIGGAITTSGILVKQTGKLFTGSLTPVGVLIKRAGKVLLGSLTPSGILATTKVTLLAVSGSIIASGILARQTIKAFVGSVTVVGSLATQKITVGGEQFYKAMGGVLTMTGSITKRISKNISGVFTAVGTLARQIYLLFIPARRIYAIASEIRIKAIALEIRIYTIGSEIRINTIASESRIYPISL